MTQEHLSAEELLTRGVDPQNAQALAGIESKTTVYKSIEDVPEELRSLADEARRTQKPVLSYEPGAHTAKRSVKTERHTSPRLMWTTMIVVLLIVMTLATLFR